MDTKFNISKETQRQLIEIYELRIKQLQKRIEYLEGIINDPY